MFAILNKENMKKLRVLHYPQIPCKPFIAEVENEKEAYIISETLAHQHLFLFAYDFIPDYSNIILVQMYDEKEEDWVDYYNEQEDMDWNEYIDNYYER